MPFTCWQIFNSSSCIVRQNKPRGSLLDYGEHYPRSVSKQSYDLTCCSLLFLCLFFIDHIGIFCQVLGDIERKVVVYAACEDARLPGATDKAVITWSCGGAEQGAGVSLAMTWVGALESSQGGITLMVNSNYPEKSSKNCLWDNDLGAMHNSVRGQWSGS